MLESSNLVIQQRNGGRLTVSETPQSNVPGRERGGDGPDSHRLLRKAYAPSRMTFQVPSW